MEKKNQVPTTPDLEDRILQYTSQHLSQRAIADTLGVTRKVVRTIQKRLGITPRSKGDIREPIFEVDAQGLFEKTVESKGGTRVQTLEQLIEAAKIDEDLWEIYRHVINKWEVAAKQKDGSVVIEPLWQVKAWLRKRQEKEEIELLKHELMAFIDKNAPVVKARKNATFKRPWNRNLLEIGCYDLHMGKLAWAEETGQDFDLSIAKDVFGWSIDQLLAKVSHYNIERVLFPIGQDYFQIDDNTNETPQSGNKLDVDTRWLKLIRAGKELIVDAIDRLLEVAPVDLLVIPGNHDKHSAFMLGEILDAWYKDHGDVSIMNSARTRKYYPFGRVLLGFSHGMGRRERPEDLSRLMPVEAAKYWSKSLWREMHLGHIHHRVVKDDLKEFNGIIVRYLPALCATDAWHFEEGYSGNVRAAEAYVWNYEAGLSSIEVANLPVEAQA